MTLAEPPLEEPSRYIDRELSWLDFHGRVLALAEDEQLPVLERAKFLAVLTEHLDEFFELRVAALKEKRAAGVATHTDAAAPLAQLRAIRSRVLSLVEGTDRAFLKGVVPGLAAAGVVLSDWDELDADDREYLVRVFDERIFPVLTPLAVDPAHPFPFISHLSLNLAVIVRDPEAGHRRFARVKIPPLLQRFVVMADGERFVAIEQVIAAHLSRLFPGMEIEAHHGFRVTRNADLTLEEQGADDLLAAVELELRRRVRPAVRLEVQAGASQEVIELLTRELDLGPDDVYEVEAPLDLSGLWSVYELERPELRDEPWVPVTQARLVGVNDAAVDMFEVIAQRDLLLHHPYESFASSVEEFIEQAAVDPRVLAIKQTLYRTSAGDSSIVRALIRAAQEGKQVAVIVEVKARGDEQANIAWARALEEAGVHVVYGLVGLKTHVKAILVVRDEGETIRRYAHIGTGNYNPRTARRYEDIGLLTADPELGSDVSALFNALTGYSKDVSYKRLLVAPLSLRTKLLELIAAEEAQGADGRIVIKANGLLDTDLIDALYAASAAAVRIDLIIRGACALRPGVAGLSENIRVRSLVGPYLEHSRILAFGSRGERQFYIGSADLMPRNLDRRVEALAPVADPELQAQLQEVLDANLADDELSWELLPDGSWRKVPAGSNLNAQRRLQELALERTRRRRQDA